MKIKELNKLAIYAALGWTLLSVGFIIIAFKSGKNPYGPFSLVQAGSLAFYTVIVTISIRAFRNDLDFRFKDAGIFSIIVTIGSSLLTLIFGLIYMKATWDDNFPVYYDYMVDFYKAMAESGEMDRIGDVDEEKLAKSIESLKSVSAFNIVYNDFSLKMITSLILSFIIAVLFRKSNPQNL